MQRKGFFARLADLWRGFWGSKLDGAESRNAEAVYHSAIRQRTEQYDKLKDAVARMVYMRNRNESDIVTKEKDLSLIERALEDATRADHDDRALVLIRKRRAMEAELERLREDLVRFGAQAASAKESLKEIGVAIKSLKEERNEMLARKNHAVARQQIMTALQETSGDFKHVDKALENVRESIMRLEHSVDLDAEDGTDPVGDVSLRTLRREAEDRDDLAELQALKRQYGKRLLTDGFTDSFPEGFKDGFKDSFDEDAFGAAIATPEPAGAAS